MKILLLSFLLSFSALAQVGSFPADPSTQICPTCPACPPIVKEERSSATNREDSFGTLMGGFQFFNTWVPAKLTGTYTQIFNRDFSLEFEYATSQREITVGGFNLGLMKEKRYSLLLKYYVGTSFHLSLGPYINDLSFKLDDNVKDAAGNSINDTVEVSVVGVAFGIGNRWQYNNGLTFGIDWLRINQPTGSYKVNERITKQLDEEDQEDVKKTGKIFRTFPTFTMFGVNVGYTF